MTPQRFQTLQRVLQQRQMDLTVVMDGVHKPHNFNAIVRSCDAVGIFEAHYVPVAGGYKPFANTAKGSEKYVFTKQHAHFSDAASLLKAQGYQLLAAHLSPQAVDFRSIDYTRPTAVVMGAELAGIAEPTAALVDQHIVVPMHGMVESLNVSVACATILFEAQRQRAAADMYRQCRLPKELYDKVLFEWSWPKIAEICRRNHQPYPSLNEDGEIEQR